MPHVPNIALAVNPADCGVGLSQLSLIGPSTAANLGGSNIVAVPYNQSGDILFRIAALSTETIACQISNDGGNNYSAALIVVNATTGVDTANATLANGYYVLPMLRFGSPSHVKFTKSSTVDSCAIAVSVAGVQTDW